MSMHECLCHWIVDFGMYAYVGTDRQIGTALRENKTKKERQDKTRKRKKGKKKVHAW